MLLGTSVLVSFIYIDDASGIPTRTYITLQILSKEIKYAVNRYFTALLCFIVDTGSRGYCLVIFEICLTKYYCWFSTFRFRFSFLGLRLVDKNKIVFQSNIVYFKLFICRNNWLRPAQITWYLTGTVIFKF